jgi:hypothetical protein
MTAHRGARGAEGKFVQISNAALQDRRLSLSARGLIAFVLSLPTDKTFSAAWLETQVPDGRRAIRSALRELQSAGYYRRARSSKGGTWVWDQVISDVPVLAEDDIEDEESPPQESPYSRNRPHGATCGNTSGQVDASDRIAPDASRPDKELNTEDLKHEDPKMASRRVLTSGSRATRTHSRILADVRQAIEAHGDGDAGELTDGQVLGLYFKYGNPKTGRVGDLVAYLTGIFSHAPYLDTFLANAEPACVPCWCVESDCQCDAA